MLREVLDLYQDDFLGGFYVSRAPVFEQWVLQEREELQKLTIQGLHVLANHYLAQDDYAAGSIPTLPVAIGIERTLYHMGLYVFAYVGVALFSPWLVHASWLYMLLVLPFAVMVLLTFFRYHAARAQAGWLPFFLWTNFSMLVFLFVPLLDKWHFLVFPYTSINHL